MSAQVDATHDPDLRSWVESANQPGCDFPIQNLPIGLFRSADSPGRPRIGIAIGDRILDLAGGAKCGLLKGDLQEACQLPGLNGLMALGPARCTALRITLSGILNETRHGSERDLILKERLLLPITDADLLVPAAIGDYTDFYASVFHAANVGSMLRPDHPLLPNYKYVPVAYHGRASSIVASGRPVRRPWGQVQDETTREVSFRPSRLLDYELEVGIFVGAGNALGEPIPIEEADSHIFGLCLLNDWSARDLQKWEYQPLGPFLAKNFATSVSPWIVTREALAPFRCRAYQRPAGDPDPLPYLHSDTDSAWGGIDVQLEVYLLSAKMRQAGLSPHRVSRGSLRDMYWTPGQMIAHHASSGCNLRPGDLIGTGTVSGAAKDSRGCLLELTWRGRDPVLLPTGELRRFLDDEDEVILRGFCEREGFARIGFGECRARIEGARQS
jgi:fumarylacetoacetase